jgi:hypothetical protein
MYSERSDIVVINGPTVDIYRPEGCPSAFDYSPGVVYSIQLTSGLIVTSPDRFPSDNGR